MEKCPFIQCSHMKIILLSWLACDGNAREFNTDIHLCSCNNVCIFCTFMITRLSISIFPCKDGWQESEWLILPLLLIANENCGQLSAVTLLWQGLSLRDTQILLDTVLQTESAEINERSLKGFDSIFISALALRLKIFSTISLLLIILRMWKQNKQTI